MKTTAYLTMALIIISGASFNATAQNNDAEDEKYIAEALEASCECFDTYNISSYADLEMLDEEESIEFEACMDQLEVSYPEIDQKMEAISEEKLIEMVKELSCSEIMLPMIGYSEYEEHIYDKDYQLEYIENALDDICDCIEATGAESAEEIDSLDGEALEAFDGCLNELIFTYPNIEGSMILIGVDELKGIIEDNSCDKLLLELFEIEDEEEKDESVIEEAFSTMCGCFEEAGIKSQEDWENIDEGTYGAFEECSGIMENEEFEKQFMNAGIIRMREIAEGQDCNELLKAYLEMFY